MIVLGIESSCDETGIGIISYENDTKIKVLANEVASSVSLHAKFGGVVPEIAARAHLESLLPTIKTALQQANIAKPDAIAVTVGPGLAGALMIGLSAAKSYALVWNVPLYGVNHLVAHIAIDILTHGTISNAVALLVSGGHTSLFKITDLTTPFVELGSTIDDAAGEAFDKVARILDLGYPGGPAIDNLAKTGNPSAINFPRALLNKSTTPSNNKYDFSFSGLKTAVMRYINEQKTNNKNINKADIAASFQEAVADVLTQKTIAACNHLGINQVVLGGGTSANTRLRELMISRCQTNNIKVRIPPREHCTDNGLMIAILGAKLIKANINPTALNVGVSPNLPASYSFI